MQGDKLASGARSATFSVAPNLRFDEGQMHDDIKRLTREDFITKYMVTSREYDILQRGGNNEAVAGIVTEMAQAREAAERALALDAKQIESLNRDCFITPFVPLGLTGRVIVSRDDSVAESRLLKSPILLPKSMRKERSLLPTTGHIIKAAVFDSADGTEHSDKFMGLRVLFGPMSGTPICFTNYPTWRLLELAEILAIVNREDTEILEEKLEPMV